MTRRLEVGPERVIRWLDGFAERHDGALLTEEGAVVRAEGGDGAVAVCTSFPHDPLGLVLVRRGGYAVGLAHADRLTAHKCGTRYVQSRTAAGGWSQQRFARRRGNQADELVRAVAEHALRLLPQGSGLQGIVVGGDRALVRDVLADPRLAHLDALPRRELYDLPDPKLAVLQDALRRGRAVWVDLDEPDAARAQ
ncbi:acVLRF1 family peptidyl-tRNA hydrolase [Knoellia sp. p5-6-4]|uniref:acVLRF1 family peptidyl-tRNA hydrolase n=1 Tax=unclassified Knoellia TaxID=2618719 RepID=UPI0023DC0D37|nr:acVLRF1 family peptidyl-tRNA hydrolase [Knoellia sp. p5-6-4]MDF2145728.1 acVLRF1 family peptidyl-tRNA hydrolase [Knoellia sp. p5-6-4]